MFLHHFVVCVQKTGFPTLIKTLSDCKENGGRPASRDPYKPVQKRDPCQTVMPTSSFVIPAKPVPDVCYRGAGIQKPKLIGEGLGQS